MKKIISVIFLLLTMSSLVWAKGGAPPYPNPNSSKEMFPYELPNKQWVYINKKGEIILRLVPGIRNPSPFADGRAQVWKTYIVDNPSARRHLMDEKGELIDINSTVHGLDYFSEGLAGFTPDYFSWSTATDTNKWGYIDKDGNVAVKAEFDYFHKFSEGVAFVLKDKKWVGIDRSGKMVISRGFDFVMDFKEGLAVVNQRCAASQGNCAGFIDKTGNFVIEPMYRWARSFSEGLSAVQINDKFGYINKKNKMVIEVKFYVASDFHEGLAAVALRGDPGHKFGYINKKGEFVIPNQFDDALSFSEGLAAVMVNGKWGFINTKGEMVIGPQYDYADYFWGGMTQVTKKYQGGKEIKEWIDKEGKLILVKE